MALLNPVYWEVINPKQKEILEFIGRQSFSSRFYLAGGTALALQLGHRKSIDLDFFSTEDELQKRTREEIIKSFTHLVPQIVVNTDGNLRLLVSGTSISFFSYGYKLIQPTPSLMDIAVASIVDIGLMKIDAIMGRGSRRDFIDLYAIIQKIPLVDLLSRGKEKYPFARDFQLMALESVVIFDLADADIQPEMLAEIRWDQVKDFFIQEVRRIGKEWFQ